MIDLDREYRGMTRSGRDVALRFSEPEYRGRLGRARGSLVKGRRAERNGISS